MLSSIRIVLVNTTHPGNIGGVARAMKNMGLSKLTLVEPKHPLDEQSHARAAGAEDILAAAQFVSTLAEAVADCQMVMATSARSRHIPWPIMDPREMASVISRRSQAPETGEVAIVFGREDRGLTNEELHLCQHHVCIPTAQGFSSLNIAAAVQVLAYELRMADLGDTQNVLQWGTQWDAPLAEHAELEGMFDHLEEVAQQTGFLDPQNPRQLMTRLRRLLLRSLPDKIEVNIIRGLLTSISKAQKNHK